MYTVVTILSVLLLLALWFGLYRPLIRRLDREIKDVRRLLLVLPDEVSKSIPSVVAAGRSMLLESGATAVAASFGADAPTSIAVDSVAAPNDASSA
jgi:hypothetical protein